MIYAQWTPQYSGEEFDRMQNLARQLTELDRKAGRQAPDFGYSRERAAQAVEIIKAARHRDVEYGAEADAQAVRS